MTSLSVDSRKALPLLDHSAAFDTTDHSLLYDCLYDWFGLDGTALFWIKSYLSNYKEKIKTGDGFSEAIILPFGVLQGFVLGPLLFNSIHVPSVKSFPNLMSLITCMLMTPRSTKQSNPADNNWF